MAVRLSDSLRAFAGVCKREFSDSGPKVSLTRPVVSRWNALVEFVLKQAQQSSNSYKLNQLLNDARRNISNSLKNVAVDTQDDSSIVDMFIIVVRVVSENDELDSKITNSQYEKIKSSLGFSPPREEVAKLSSLIVEFLRTVDRATAQSVASSGFASELNRQQFGKSLKLTSFGEDAHPAGAVSDGDKIFFSDEEESRPAASSLFSFANLNDLHAEAKSQNDTKAKKPARKAEMALSVGFIVANSNLSEPVARDLFDSLMSVLRSKESDAAIQGQLVDLVGFENVELVAKLIENRSACVSQPTGAGNENEWQIRTQDETRVRNRARKKQRRAGAAASDSDSDEDGVINIPVSEFKDREQMAAQQRAAARAKVPEWKPRLAVDGVELALPGASSGLTEAERVALASGNVYDASLVARSSAAYVGSAKLALPEGVVRRTTEEYEEITLPAPSRGPNDCPIPRERLVPISRFDEIGRRVFAGIERLNAVQSVVFETAYGTNENLLVSAPTGAGKTNVALLTIVRELKQHVMGGQNDGRIRLRTNEFKIVYVAPMKALATEMTANFSRRLSSIGVTVAELTGDTQLTRAQLDSTQLFVTTPEKWDVLTRKSVGDAGLTQLVRLLIIDEVHLLADERGAVLEALVARTLRQVESNQRMIRLVGLSATLPNYVDVARFLRVNPARGLFFFDGRFRPVPLSQSFVGVKARNKLEQVAQLNRACYEKVVEQVRAGHQVLVFVHARNETVRTAMLLRDQALQRRHTRYFVPFRFRRRTADQNAKNNRQSKDEDNDEFEEVGLDERDLERMPEDVRKLMEADAGEQERLTKARNFGRAEAVMNRSSNRELRELFRDGFAVHHRGVERRDRQLVERYFAEGWVRCLVCTATLAWGVNLPAHAVVIKGTQLYDASRSAFVDLSLLDVLQIFGRAGRPQYDSSGLGIILTTHDKLASYLRVLTQQEAIESRFAERLPDHLNAEVALGTVSSLDDAVRWLSYTYLFVRARRNPTHYNFANEDLTDYCRSLALQAAQVLDRARMIRFNEVTQTLSSTDRGRIASHLYVQTETVETFNSRLVSGLLDKDVLNLLCAANEFSQVKVREDEMNELDMLSNEHCSLAVRGGLENECGKVNVLLQTYIAGALPSSFSLVSDQAFVAQNAARLARALFELALHRSWAAVTERLLRMTKMIEQRLPPGATPLRQLDTAGLQSLGPQVYEKIERHQLSIERLRELETTELGMLIRHAAKAGEVKQRAALLPAMAIDTTVQPITRTVLRMTVRYAADFVWHDRVHAHGAGEPFWLLVEDPDSDLIHHYEQIVVSRRNVISREWQTCTFAIPVEEPLPAQYLVRLVSDRWIGVDSTSTVSFKRIVLPLAAAGRLRAHAHTELLDLRPLPITALHNPQLEAVYASRFSHFNAVQTQTFHALYYTDVNVLLGAPTGSGKTVAAELAIFRVLQTQPNSTCVYIAPLKALVRERVADWRARLPFVRIVELSGDVAPDIRAVERAQLIITTPEKWDGVSRGWRQRGFVRRVRLIVLDEIHLLGEDRGPVLEVIVSRANYIVAHTKAPIRLVGLSTALANAADLADWLGVPPGALFNFRPAVRPVPLDVHISAFAGKHYCPRMATMNRPAFNAILTHSPEKPTLIFVSSRRQTRLTALDLIAFLGGLDNPKRFVHVDERELEPILHGIKDANLKLTLAFGIGLHHAGLHETDRVVVERLFVSQQIGVLVATSTLAWGVNFPAHLVIVKGTEYYDGKTHRYVDYPITDVLQMMGRAGRPQFDDHGVACIFVHNVKKDFYKKFLYEPFPVESSLLGVLHDHLNAEIVGGTVCTKQDAILYLHHTYLMRRLVANPSYYELDSLDDASAINLYLTALIDKTVNDLSNAGCVEVAEDGSTLNALTYGQTTAFYYVHYRTGKKFGDSLSVELDFGELMTLIADAHEFDELPVRHNEDLINTQMVQRTPLSIDALRKRSPEDPHLKTLLLFAAHFSRATMPISDYATDLKTVLDQSVRLLQCAIDLAAEHGLLANTVRLITLSQMLVQACWPHDDPVLKQLPQLGLSQLDSIAHCIASLRSSTRKESQPQPQAQPGRSITMPELLEAYATWPAQVAAYLHDDLQLSPAVVNQVTDALTRMPIIAVDASVSAIQAERGSETVHLDLLNNSQWIPLKRDTEYVISISLNRLSAVSGRKVLAPRFPKAKNEMWYLLLGVVDQRELVALRRVHEIGRALGGNVKPIPLVFRTPENTGRVIYSLYLLSDSYRGLDQQYALRFEVN